MDKNNASPFFYTTLLLKKLDLSLAHMTSKGLGFFFSPEVVPPVSVIGNELRATTSLLRVFLFVKYKVCVVHCDGI